MKTVTLQVHTVNRIGMTHDVIECLIDKHVDVIGMEVRPAIIYLKIPAVHADLQEELIKAMRKVPGVKQVETIRYLPNEERENRMHTILSTVSEGILSLDEHLRIRTVNVAAEQMLRIRQGEAMGKTLQAFAPALHSHAEHCLQDGVELPNMPVRPESIGKDAPPLMGSFFPIRSANHHDPQGVVIVLRDMKQVQELIESAKRAGVYTLDQIVHRSHAMRTCMETARRIAKSNATVFLYGESGTGKELFARAIHFESARGHRPFIPVNCAAIPESLMESEWFGYEEGAFTGAAKGGKPGLFELAHGGTLFLDEVAEIPLHLQAKLLRVLEDKTIRRVGGSQLLPLDVRIIAATNKNLATMVQKGEFREDLYYRLHVIPLHIPPLRERAEDIPVLADHFVRKISQEINRQPLPLSVHALASLQQYHWPGNVRELQNVIERAVYLCPEDATEIPHVYLSHDTSEPAGEPSRLSLKEQVEAYEKTLLLRELDQQVSVRRLASRLGISHTALLKKLKKFGLGQGHEESQ